MDFSYQKHEKLKSRKTIDALFSDGKTVAKYPLRLVYAEVENQQEPFKIGVSVSKKNFRHAVDRNYFKRVLRECYRLNKSLLPTTDKKFAVMFFYQTKDRLSYAEIGERTVQLFGKFAKAVQQDE